MSNKKQERIDFDIPSNPEYMFMLRALVAHACCLSGLTKEDSSMIPLAVDEAFSNIVKHCYCMDFNERVTISFLISERRLEIQLRDYGNPVDPSKIKGRDLEDVKPGGLGVHFLHSIMDEVKYEPCRNKGTLLKLVKYGSLPKESDQEENKKT